MTLLLEIDLPVRISPGFPEAVLDVRVTPRFGGPFDPVVYDPEVFDVGWSFADQAQLAVDLDASLGESVWLRAGREQILPPWRIQVGTVEVPWYRLLPGATVTESIDGVTTFGFTLSRRGSGADPFLEPLGSPRTWLGVPGGNREVTITADILTPSGRRSVPLVRGGVLDNTSATVGDGGDTRTFNGGGAHGRFDRVPVTYQAPPGHGQTSGTVVRRLLELAGVPAAKIAISGGRRLYKAVEVIDRPAVEAANAILEPELKRVAHDARTDTWRLLDYGGVAGKRIEAVIRESDVLATLGQLGDAAAADAPTSVVLTGTAQVTREECGRRIDYKVIDTFAVREIRGVRATQEVDGSLTAVAWGGSPAALRRVRRQVIVTEVECETVVATETATWEWMAPETWRYELDNSGAIGGYRVTGTSGFIFDAGAVADDSSPMYEWPTERFTLTAWQREEHAFDSRNYRVGTTVRRGGWRSVEVPLKIRAASSDPWEGEAFEVVRTMADGRPVADGERWYGPSSVYDESSRLLQSSGHPPLHRVKPPLILAGSVGLSTGVEREVVTYSVDDSGFIIAEVTAITRWAVLPGVGLYLYQAGESTSPAPAFVEVEQISTAYAAAGESAHDRFAARSDHTGRTVEATEERGISGYLPAAEQRMDIVPPASTYDDPAEAGFALAASRQESRPIKVRVDSPALRSVLTPWELKGRTVEHAESEDDLAVVGEFAIREASSIGVSVPLSFNPLIRPGHRIVVDLPSLGFVYDVLVEQVQHHLDERATWTQVQGRHDVV